MRILYSFNKPGEEGECCAREIAGASSRDVTFVPFNHQAYLPPTLYSDATKLDGLFRAKHPRLMAMYADLTRALREQRIDAMIVANCPPYHPEFLRTLTGVYKVLYSADDPGATYLINIPYLHAYDHVFFVAPAYSRELSMREKMHYAGMSNADWLPIAVFDFECAPSRSAHEVRTQPRDIDVVYIGAFWRQKIETLATVRRALGRRFKVFGMFRSRHNVYVNAKYRAGMWVRPVSLKERVSLYQRAKIGINIHYNEYGLGNQRLFQLPANGAMQVCDCAPILDTVFEPGAEIVGYESSSDLIDVLQHYLAHDDERSEIAMRGYDRTMREYRFPTVTRRAAELIRAGMRRAEWPAAS
jgi:spore maturation protein CgeB